MTEQRHQELIQQCCDKFKHETRLHFNHHVADLAAYIVLQQTPDALEAILEPIIQAGAIPVDLLRSLIQCQLLVLEEEASNVIHNEAGEHIQAFKTTLEHFHFIATSIISIGEKKWLESIKKDQDQLKSKHETNIIETAVQTWQCQKKIKCLNYYKGLPVQAIVAIERIHTGEKTLLAVKHSRELARVLAIADQHYVLVPDGNDEELIEMNVHHIGESSITFHAHTLSQLKKRKHFRLQPLQAMAIALYHDKNLIGHGEVLDFSLGNMDVSMPVEQCASLNVDEIIDIQFQINETAISGTAWVRAIRHHDQHCFLCLELIPHALMQRHLQQEIASLQRKIIQEIKEKFTPQIG